MNPTKILKPVAPLLATLALLAGCASATAPTEQEPQASTPEEIVAHRATQQFDHIVKEEYEKAYAYMAPSYRALVDLEKFSSLYHGDAGSWKEGRVVRVTCESEQRCVASMELGMELVLRKGRILKTGVEQTWVREDGQWWHYRPL